jgi:3alpha(or 20beta)-hydroxysteroid dehydrogenase
MRDVGVVSREISDLSGKVIFVSGGAGSLGAAHAACLLSQGARVVLGDVRVEEGVRIAESLGPRCASVHLDVTREESWVEAIASACDRFDGLDGLVNNAGVIRTGLVESMALADFEAVVSVSLTGSFLGTKCIVPALRARGGGSIVNISSIAGLRGVAGLAAYSAAKFAIRGLTKSSALELGRYGIRVNSVHPGGIDTVMTQHRQFDNVDKAAIYASQPIPRIGQPEEVSHLVAFLLSNQSSFSTGSEFVLDGGATAGESYRGLDR